MKKTIYTSVAVAALLATVSGPIASIVINDNQNQVEAAATPAEQTAFINKIAPFAQKSANQYGVYPSIMMAQAILESSWGQSDLASAPYYNLFGMKFKVGYDEGKYGVVYMDTQEYENGKYVTKNLPFRTYSDFSGSFGDNGLKLRKGPDGLPADYYKGTWLENASSPQDSANWLQGRYATSITYASGLMGVVNRNNLTRFDPVYTTLNKKMYVKADASLYNTFSGVKVPNGTVKRGSSYKVLRSVKLYDGSLYYELGRNQWVMGGTMSDSATQAPSQPNNATPISGTAKINYKPGYGIAVWTAPNGHAIAGKHLAHGSNWKVFSKVSVGGRTWYNVGTNQWIDGQYVILNGASTPNQKPQTPNTNGEVKVSGIMTINYVPNYYVFLRDGNGKMTSQKLKHGLRYKVFAKKYINGKLFYRLGTDKQWMEAKYLK